MYDIISIGSSVVDSFIISKAFTVKKSAEGTFLCQMYGEKIDVDEYILRSGGGGSNTAVGFARMGFRAGIVTELGKDVWAQFILDELRKEFVATNMVVAEKNEKTGGSIILLGEDGNRTIMVHRGAAAQLDPKDIPSAQLSRAKWVHLSSIAGQEATLKFIFEVVRDADTKMSWNPGNKELELLATGKINLNRLPIDILFVNKHEWDSISEVRSQILEAIPQIVVTNGKYGGEVFVEGKAHTKFFAREKKIVDETGAGDSFIVGYVTSQLKGNTIIDSCNWGKRNAESVISVIGAKPGLLTINQIESHNDTHD
ncbi:MAG: ribokinase [Patescibacteria group bacterium]|nr:MAG: ribokinase [Patescibacteria group bacterium]